MDIIVIPYVIVFVLTSIWTIISVPKKQLLSKYPSAILFAGIFYPPILSKVNFTNKDRQIINKFIFRFRLFFIVQFAMLLIYISYFLYRLHLINIYLWQT